MVIDCGTSKVEIKILNDWGNHPTFLTLEGTSKSPLQLQVTGDVTLSPTCQAKCGGNETPAIKNKKDTTPKEKRPARMTKAAYRNLF